MEENALHNEWVYKKGRMIKVREMMKHPGWTEVVEPMLTAELNKAKNDLENADLKNYQQFIIVRQSVRAIKFLFAGLKTIIAQGERAAEMLEKEKE